MTWKKDQKVDFLRFEVGENDLPSFSAQSLKALLSKMTKMIFLTHYVLIHTFNFNRRPFTMVLQQQPYHCREFKLYLLTAPNATDNIVCMRSWESSPSPCWAAVITPRFPTSCPPAKLQNLTCFTPHVTNWLSESGLNSATKILSVWPWELASLMPKMREKRCIIL